MRTNETAGSISSAQSVVDEQNRQDQRQEDQQVREGLGPPEAPLGLHNGRGICQGTAENSRS